MSAGSQQPPEYGDCQHLGLLMAATLSGTQPVGRVWRCTCGKEYVVRRNNAGLKVLEAKDLR